MLNHDYLTIWYRPYDPGNASGCAPPCCTIPPQLRRNKRFHRWVVDANCFDNPCLGNHTPSRVSICSGAVCWLCEGRTTPSKASERRGQQVVPAGTYGRYSPPRCTACLSCCEFINILFPSSDRSFYLCERNLCVFSSILNTFTENLETLISVEWFLRGILSQKTVTIFLRVANNRLGITFSL